jgi:AcrR family transcriptional regulator
MNFTLSRYSIQMPQTKKRESVESAYHHGDLRRALVDAALTLLEAGKEPTLRAVARQAGVSHTAPYHHFPDRRSLMAAVAEEALLGLRDATQAAAAAGPPEPLAQLLEIGVAYVRFAVENPVRFRLMFSAELAERSDLPGLQSASAEAYGVLQNAVRRMYGPRAQEDAVAVTSLGAWSKVHGLAMLILDDQVPSGKDPEIAALIARQVLTGEVGNGGETVC